ncbi:MAG TPA: hypothetical protein VJ576_20020 [Rhodocyclaceae bacterium]|nr:hypothetical protein [Rhodocyclaceae bacterium]
MLDRTLSIQQFQQQFPPIISATFLGLLLDKAPATIIADHSRAPEKLPPAFKPPGSKSPLWITEDVIAWLRKHPAEKGESSNTNGAGDHTKKRCVGAPTKAERHAAAKAGLSVKEYRQRHSELS